MKKFIILGLALATIGFTSCSDDDDDTPNCGDLADDITITADAYSENDSDENCIEYKNAIEAYIAQCEDEEASEYELILESLPCAE